MGYSVNGLDMRQRESIGLMLDGTTERLGECIEIASVRSVSKKRNTGLKYEQYYRTCPVCGKRFYAAGEWVYKSSRVKRGEPRAYLCSYGCMRVEQRVLEEEKKSKGLSNYDRNCPYNGKIGPTSGKRGKKCVNE